METVPIPNDDAGAGSGNNTPNGSMGMVPLEGDGGLGPTETIPVRETSTAPPRRQLSNISLPQTTSGSYGTSANLVNSIVGAGIMGIPYAFRQAGLIAGIFLLVLVGWLTDKSLRLIVELAYFHPTLKPLGVYTFEDLMSLPYGKIGRQFVLANMFILAYGAMVAYLLIIKDTVPVLLGLTGPESGSGGFLEREFVMIVTSVVIILPLAMQRDMANLSFTSTLSVLADVILVGFVVGYAPVAASVNDAGGFGQVLKESSINEGLFIGLGVLSTAMACQHSAFIVSNSMAEKTAKAWSSVTCQSIFIASFLCLLMGLIGYLGFLSKTEGNILNNFPADSVESNGARGLLAITMFFTYPMESFVARHVCFQLGGYTDDEQSEGFFGRRQKYTLLIYVATLIPALVVDDLGPVLSITGSLGGSCIAYIGPGLAYLGVHGSSFLEYTAGILHSKQQSSKTDEALRHGGTAIELPVVGDADATMRTAPDAPSDPFSMKDVRRPWWWYVALFPVWCRLAEIGNRNMKRKLQEWDETHDQPLPPAAAEEEEHGDVIGPHKRDYCISMFFISFGMLAAVVGLISNIYVQMRNIFFTPH